MRLSRRRKIGLLVVGDIATLYLALNLTLLIRYGALWQDELSRRHAFPFTVIFTAWLVVFYIAGLYDLRRLRNNLDFFKTAVLTLFVNVLLAIIFFYLIPIFGITPKTNLFIFIGIFIIIGFIWRRFFNYFTADADSLSKVILIGENDAVAELVQFLSENPQIGYAVVMRFDEDSLPDSLETIRGWRELIRKNEIDLIVIPPQFKKESRFAKIFYHLLASGIEVRDIPGFYEMIFRKINLSQISEEWFLEHIAEHHRFYDDLKWGGEIFGALLLEIILPPLEIVIATVIALSSPGPVIYKQVRVGRHGKEFTLYKFRTMHVDAEKNGAQWAQAKDARSTTIGNMLRYTHLDELPQLWNIIRGDISFIGPRPERPEFVHVLREKIPYYDVRHLVKPGLTGWAQINYRYGASVDDSYEKLQYDIYYIKNRSLILDLAILVKTIKSLFINAT